MRTNAEEKMMSETPEVLLFDWEDVLVCGPFLDRLAACSSLRLAVLRREAKAVFNTLEVEELRKGNLSLEALGKVLGEHFQRDLSLEEMEDCIRSSMVYDLDGLALLDLWTARGKAAVVGGSPPRVPEKLRQDFATLLRPEHHVYAHEAGHSNLTPEFYKVVAEALEKEPTSLFLLSKHPQALVAAQEAGCGAVQYRGRETEIPAFDLPPAET
jgi:FMN phosphatase YigB (HAD superfamily)